MSPVKNPDISTGNRTSHISACGAVPSPTAPLLVLLKQGVVKHRVGQKQLDDLNLATCRHLYRWRGKTHIAGYSGLKPAVIMQRWSEERRAFAVETFFKKQ